MSNFVTNTTAAMVGGVSAYYMREYFKGAKCQSQERMDGKTVVITGCNTGIGKETALDLSKRGARVVMACRSLARANSAAEEIKCLSKNSNVAVYHLDLASLKSVRQCAKNILENEERIDVLINNAGIMMCPNGKTEDGLEMQIGTNHFGHFLFTNLLLDKIKASDSPARIVNVSSRAHERGTINFEDLHYETRPYDSNKAYSQSKLANILFTKELSKRLESNNVTCYALHPGVVRTELARHIEEKIGILMYLLWFLLYFFTKSPTEGAQTSIYCAVAKECEKETGKYYSDCKEKEPIKLAQDDQVAKKLWDISEKTVKL